MVNKKEKQNLCEIMEKYVKIKNSIDENVNLCL